jgi:hypothetical protein
MERLVPSFPDSLGSFMHFPEPALGSDPFPTTKIASKPPKAPSRLQRFRPPPLTLPGESTDQRVPSLNPQEVNFAANARFAQHAPNRKLLKRTGRRVPKEDFSLRVLLALNINRNVFNFKNKHQVPQSFSVCAKLFCSKTRITYQKTGREFCFAP